MNYLDLDDFLLIAQAVTGIDAERLARLPRMTLAESALASPRAGFGGEDAYPGLAEKAAVLCWHLARNHPLPDGNKRAAFVSMVELLHRNGFPWPVPYDLDDAEQVVRGVAAGSVDVEELTVWVREQTGAP